MSSPTIELRLQKRFILMTTNTDFQEKVRELVPDDWSLSVVTDLDDLGEWNEVLLYRFLLMDLDEFDAFDPLDVIRQIRMQYQINIPVFCFGGDSDIQDEMRLSRADRFFSQPQMLESLPQYFAQYNW
ncbi:MAG: hypothetical protein OEX07_00525 [Gammaproteobacteria bacterium]|nr:hypothetical protein [Gammaproteobacteria bacterium]